MILITLRLILFTGFFTFRLFFVSLDVASESGEGETMTSVEMCQCPPGYAGTSCEVSP